MRDDRPSETAWRSARRRAAHQLWDTPRVYDDPLALKIMGPDEEAALRAKSARSVSALEQTIRAFMVARSRFVADCLKEAVARGVRQYVLLGSGLDTSLVRDEPGLRVFDIDHPATQGWKKTQLAATAIAVPANVTFVPVDFTRQTLKDELPRGGWDASQPAFFSWLGVTPYLSPAEIMDLLRFIASCPKGSEIVFDVSTPVVGASLYLRLARLWITVKVLMKGERNGTRFVPDVLANDVRGLGFSQVEALEGGAINARYFAGRADTLKVSTRSALIRAIV